MNEYLKSQARTAPFHLSLISLFSYPPKPLHHVLHLSGQPLHPFFLQFFRNTVKRFRNAAGNACEGIAVAAEGDRRADHIFKILSFQKCRDSLRHGLLAAFHVMIIGPDLITGPGQVISGFPRDIFPDLLFRCTGPCKKDAGGRCFRASDSFRMVVRHFRCPPCHFPRPLYRFVKPTDGRYPHRRTVPPRIIWFRIVLKDPVKKLTAVSGVRIPVSLAAHGVDQQVLRLRFACIFSCFHQRIGHSDGHHGIVRVFRSPDKKRAKVLHLRSTVKLVRRADDIT